MTAAYGEVGTQVALIEALELKETREMYPISKRSTGAPLSGNDPLSMSLDFLEDLSKTGIVLTPAEPTETMIQRGASVGGISQDQAKAVYFAMIAMGN